MSRALPENQYPDALVSGAPISTALRAVMERLKTAFAAVPGVTYEYMPPRPTKADWDKVQLRCPAVAVGWQSFSPNANVGATYSGAIDIAVFVLSKQMRREALYFGDGTVPGVLGLSAIAIRMLHGFSVAGVGSCMVRHTAAAMEADWLSQDTAMAALLVSIPNVEFADPALALQLNDFLRLGETMVTDAVPAPQTILTVRGE